jgi:hypothetical protein
MKKLFALVMLFGCGELLAVNPVSFVAAGDSNTAVSFPGIIVSYPTFTSPPALQNGAVGGSRMVQPGTVGEVPTISKIATLAEHNPTATAVVMTVGTNDIRVYVNEGKSAAEVLAMMQADFLALTQECHAHGLFLVVINQHKLGFAYSNPRWWSNDPDKNAIAETVISSWNAWLMAEASDASWHVVDIASQLDDPFSNAIKAEYGDPWLGPHFNTYAHQYVVAPAVNAALYLESAVDIDIQPSDAANPVKPTSNDSISVAVLSTNVADGDAVDFDAIQANPATLRFGIGEAQVVAGPFPVDADSDSDTDMVFDFQTQDTGIACGDTEAALTGKTYEAKPFTGTDSVTTIECVDNGCHP